jgi:hypothetical protein
LLPNHIYKFSSKFKFEGHLKNSARILKNLSAILAWTKSLLSMADRRHISPEVSRGQTVNEAGYTPLSSTQT